MINKAKFPANDKARYIKKNVGTKTPAQIAKDLHIAKSTVHVYASLLGISLVTKENKERRDRVDDALRKYAGEKSMKQLKEMLNESDHLIRYRAERLGIDVSLKKKDHVRSVGGTEMFNPDAFKNWLL